MNFRVNSKDLGSDDENIAELRRRLWDLDSYLPWEHDRQTLNSKVTERVAVRNLLRKLGCCML